MNDEQTDLLRQLIDNLDQFRESTVETFKILYRKQKQNADAVGDLRKIVNILVAVVSIIVFLLLIATIASLIR